MNFELLKKLCLLNGTSGDEKNVRDFIISKLPEDCDYIVDALGNLIVNKKGEIEPKNKVVLFAHMDEVGFIVTYITDNGFVNVTNVGGIDNSALFGKKLIINNCIGVAGAKAIHQCSSDEAKKIPEITDVSVDFGFESREEAEKYISLGDFGYFKSDFVEFGNDMIKSKALDDRLGCAIMLELLQEKSKINYTCVFTVQEEVGTRGATVSAYTVKPDYAIVIETTTASDIPDTPENKKVCKVGKGAVVSFMDRGTIYNKDLYKKAREIADKNGIANQTKTVVAGGNDASAIHKSAGGIKTVAVSLPCRYIHSASSVGSKADMESVKSLTKALLEEFANG
ncbi:MAG: M42 family metallopeptidase [Clostridia bacterium]|nr:M42 family metallopeptidase [Clostridia bacterium]